MLHGDRAIARVVGIDRKGRPEGKIVEVTERANTTRGRPRLSRSMASGSSSPRTGASARTSCWRRRRRKAPKPKSGQVVVVEIVEQPSKQSQPIGRVVEVLGNYADPGMEIEIALRKHDLPFEFSKAALAETEEAAGRGAQDATGRAART